MMDTVIEVIDGPDDQPNRRRRVRVERPSDTAGFFLCRDEDSGERLTIHRTKLPVLAMVS